MNRKLVSFYVLATLLTFTFGMSLKVQTVEASGTIYIRADGSVEGTDKIISSDNVTYTFIGNISDSIVVERNNILVDGASYTVQGIGAYDSKGIFLFGISNVTIKNMNIKGFWYGIRLDDSSGNSIIGNIVTNNERASGIWLSSSSNNSIAENNITNNWNGIWLDYSQNNSIVANNITANSVDGIVFSSSSRCSIAGNNITTNNRNGVSLSASSNNTITGNNITQNNLIGISLYDSSNNTLSGNTIANNGYGIRLYNSSNNSFRGNNMVDNSYNFGVDGYFLLSFVNDVDVSNTVNGKPMHYWVNVQNAAIPLNAGYVALVNCTSITVQNLNLTKNIQGILLASTKNSTIINNNIMANDWAGIWLFPSSNNTITGNAIIANKGYGICLSSSPNNSIVGNNIRNNNDGVYLSFSSSNNIYGNNIASNGDGIELQSSSNNIFYHNNFINNTKQVYDGYPYATSINVWDDGYPSGGNYWSDYDGFDSDPDGIGDSEYVIDTDNIDHYPLMGIFHSFNTPLGLPINVISNSTIENFGYFESNNTITMHVSNMTSNQTFGFIRICIPHALMNETYHVTIDGAEPYYVNYTLYDNGTHRWIYFSYQHSTLEIIIIPEFPSFFILPLFMIATLLAVIVYKRKYH